jgi:hypothetical protein
VVVRLVGDPDEMLAAADAYVDLALRLAAAPGEEAGQGGPGGGPG